MSRINKRHNCKCIAKIKIVEENLAVLQNLLVKKDLFIEGNLLVNGRITDWQGNPPQFGGPQEIESPVICTTGLSSTDPSGTIFNLNQALSPCSLIVQGLSTTVASRVLYGSQTPNGVYLVINYSTQAIVTVERIEDLSGSAFTIPVAPFSEPVVARLVINGGILTQGSIISPPS